MKQSVTSLEAVLFDMDGVLVDSEEQWRRIEGPFFKKLIPAWRPEDHKKIVGLGVLDLFKLLKTEYGLQTTWAHYREECQTIAEEVYLRRVTRADGALELISELKKHKIPVGLASSSPREWIQMVLNRFDLERHFNTIVSADDVGGEGKPSPAIYLRATRNLGADPGRSAAIEDSRHGVLSAKKAGMICIAFKNGSNEDQDLSGADFEIHEFSELSVQKLRSLIPSQTKRRKKIPARWSP